MLVLELVLGEVVVHIEQVSFLGEFKPLLLPYVLEEVLGHVLQKLLFLPVAILIYDVFAALVHDGTS